MILEDVCSDFTVLKFDYILSAKAFHEVQAFLEEEYSFSDVCKQLHFYLEKRKEVTNLWNYRVLVLFHVDLKTLKHQLIALHDNLVEQLKTAATKLLRNLKREICSEFETVKKTLLTVPATAKEMVALFHYFDNMKKNNFDLMLEKVKDVLLKTSELMKLIPLESDDIKLNIEMLMWPQKFNPIFKECSKILEESKLCFEDKLAAAIKKVKVDLQNLAEHAADLETLGDINMVQEYRKEARNLVKRLKATEAAIAWINEEESLAKQAPTSYPEVTTILDVIEPFSQLYQLYVEWDEAEKEFVLVN